MKHKVVLALLICCAACTPQKPPTGSQAIQKEATWNQAREVYFHSAKSPERSYEVHGHKGEIVDVHVYPCPRPDLVVITYGETYHNTTEWDVHVVLMKTNDVPTYPGNVYLCPSGSAFALDWVDQDSLGVYFPVGYYPDNRDYRTGAVRRNRLFQYEKKIAGITVKFIPADTATMDAKREVMNTKAINVSK
jgi:hypothetical protein